MSETILYVVYSRFVDDPSVVYGIFSTKEAAVAFIDIHPRKKVDALDWAEFKLDESDLNGVSLD